MIYHTGTVLGIIIAGVVAVNLGSDITRGHVPVRVSVPFIYWRLGQIFRKRIVTSSVSALLSLEIFKLPFVKVFVITQTGAVSKKTKYGVISVILVSIISACGGVPLIVPVRIR